MLPCPSDVLCMKFALPFPYPALRSVASQWGPRMIALGALVVLVCTLYPFRFEWGVADSLRQVLHSFSGRSSQKDMIANIILFLPYGFGWACSLWARAMQRQQRHLDQFYQRYPDGVYPAGRDSLAAQMAATGVAKAVLSSGQLPFEQVLGHCVVVAVASALLSAGVETAQVFLPSRNPTYTDVVTNTLGGCGGYLWFYSLGGWTLALISGSVQGLQRWFRQWRTTYLWMGFGSYLTLTLVLLGGLYSTSLQTWQPDLPLQLGGPAASQPLWTGTVAAVQWRDRALSNAAITQWFADPTREADSLVTDYPLSQVGDVGDRDRQSPTLRWQPAPPPKPATTPGVPLAHSYWLRTPTAVTALNTQIQQASQFSLSATVTSPVQNLEHNWFHQILTIGPADRLGNVALGQFSHHLVVWVQTAISPARRGFHQVFVGDVFADGQPHRVMVTYRGLAVKVYVDGKKRFDRSIVSDTYTIVGGLLIFAPLGFLLSMIANGMAHRRRDLGRWVGGIVLPPLLLEGLLAHLGDRPLNYSALLLALIAMGGTFLIVRESPADEGH
jgi:hypothetical protein